MIFSVFYSISNVILGHYQDFFPKCLIAIWEWNLETGILELNICVRAFVPVPYQIELYLDILDLLPLSWIIALCGEYGDIHSSAKQEWFHHLILYRVTLIFVRYTMWEFGKVMEHTK